MSDDSDQFFITKTLKEDTSAFTVLVNRYKNMVFTLAVRVLKNREEAEEAAQDTFVKAYRSLHSFKGGAKFSTWLYKIAYNSCLDRIKTYKKRYVTVELDEFTEGEVALVETAIDLMERSERQGTIMECLRQMSEEDRFLITLFYYQELSHDEISKIMNIRSNNVKVKLHRARRRLALILRERLTPETIHRYVR